MTGSLVNEKLQKIILTELYDKRNTGEPVILNDLWKRHIEYSSEFRITLQYLFKDKEYIWSERHRDIGNTYNGVEQTLENVTVRAKITEKGIDYFRKEYRDEPWKYWGLRLGVLAIIVPAVWWTIEKVNDYRHKNDLAKNSEQIGLFKDSTNKKVIGPVPLTLQNIIGDWLLCSSASGSVTITANVCTQVKFKYDNTATITPPSNEIEVVSWKISEDKLVIIGTTRFLSDTFYIPTLVSETDGLNLTLKAKNKDATYFLGRTN